MFLTSIAPESGKIYQKKTYNIPTDINMVNPNLIWVRGRIYEESEIIQRTSNSCIVELTGYLSLSEKFQIWSEYGRPSIDIYYCVEQGKIVVKEELDEDNGFVWPIGWISTEGYVIINVDLLMLLNQYHHLNGTKKFLNRTVVGVEVFDVKEPLMN
jgi:hypothetical protein